MEFSKLEINLSVLSFILGMILIGTAMLYLTKDQETLYIAKEYNTMINYMSNICNIDLNELQKENIETSRCQTMKRLYDHKIMDYNQWISTECSSA